MSTLHLVAPDYREMARLIPVFDLDTQSIAEVRQALLQAYGQRYGTPDAVASEEVWIALGAGGPPLRALLFRPEATARGAILHMHGGGWIAGTPDMMAAFCAGLAERHSVVVLSVDYRLAPEMPGDVALDDCFTALEWLHAEAERLDVPPGRIGVMGDSAGGSLAAGVALRARDEGLPVLAQVLIYPALDDRTGGGEAPAASPSAGEFVLSSRYLRQLWSARLARTTPDRLPHLAPARNGDLTGSAPAFIAVGSLDLLVDDAMDYAARLSRAGVQVELHVYPGVYHGFDLVPGSTTDRFGRDLASAIEAFLR